MAPGVSKQKELGMRWRTPGGTLLSAALFDITSRIWPPVRRALSS